MDLYRVFYIRVCGCVYRIADRPVLRQYDESLRILVDNLSGMVYSIGMSVDVDILIEVIGTVLLFAGIGIGWGILDYLSRED